MRSLSGTDDHLPVTRQKIKHWNIFCFILLFLKMKFYVVLAKVCIGLEDILKHQTEAAVNTKYIG